MALDFIEQTPSFNPGDTLWDEQGWDNWDEAFLAASHPYPGFMRAPDDAAYQKILMDIYHQYMADCPAGLVEKLIVLHNFGEELYRYIMHSKFTDRYTDISHNIYSKIKTGYSGPPFWGKCSFYYNRKKHIYLLFSEDDHDKLVEHGWKEAPSLKEITDKILSPYKGVEVTTYPKHVVDFIQRPFIELPKDVDLKCGLDGMNPIKLEKLRKYRNLLDEDITDGNDTPIYPVMTYEGSTYHFPPFNVSVKRCKGADLLYELLSQDNYWESSVYLNDIARRNLLTNPQINDVIIDQDRLDGLIQLRADMREEKAEAERNGLPYEKEGKLQKLEKYLDKTAIGGKPKNFSNEHTQAMNTIRKAIKYFTKDKLLESNDKNRQRLGRWLKQSITIRESILRCKALTNKDLKGLFELGR